MIFVCSLLLFLLLRIQGEFLLNTESSSIIVVRHIRLITDHDYYRIRCPYHLKHLTLALLNYSNDYCFHLHTKSIDHMCMNYRSPCRFHAKPVRLNCHDRTDSKQVDITYHCSLRSSLTTNTTTVSDDQEYGNGNTNSNSSSDVITLHTLSFPSTPFGIEETVGIFLLTLVAVFILWLIICCAWFIRCSDMNSDDEDGKCELLAFRPHRASDLIDLTPSNIVGDLSGHTKTGGIENLSLHVNPLENQPLSSLKIAQIV